MVLLTTKNPGKNGEGTPRAAGGRRLERLDRRVKRGSAEKMVPRGQGFYCCVVSRGAERKIAHPANLFRLNGNQAPFVSLPPCFMDTKRKTTVKGILSKKHSHLEPWHNEQPTILPGYRFQVIVHRVCRLGIGFGSPIGHLFYEQRSIFAAIPPKANLGVSLFFRFLPSPPQKKNQKTKLYGGFALAALKPQSHTDLLFTKRP